MEFELRDDATGTLVATGRGNTVSSGQVSSWTVAPGVLSDHKTYRWRARGFDGQAGNTNWSTETRFRTNENAFSPRTPDGLAPDDLAEVFTQTPTLGANFSDQDGGVGFVDFELYETGTDALVAAGRGSQAQSGSQSQWTVPAGKLQDGKRYKWRARGFDGELGSAQWSDMQTVRPSAGALISPTEGEATARRLTLRAASKRPDQTGVTYEYRRGTMGWAPIPRTNLADEKNGPAGDSPYPLSDGQSPELVWDLAATPGVDGQDGPVEVRAVFAGPGGGPSQAATAVLDQKGLSDETAREEIGPGQVDMLTGNFSVSQDDVSIASWGSDLTLTRTNNSREAGTGAEGPFGPGWVSSVSVAEAGADYVSLEEPSGQDYVELTMSDGTLATFERQGDSYAPEPGLEHLKLSKLTAESFELFDLDGNITVFTKPAGAIDFRPSEIRQPGSGNKTTYQYDVVQGQPRVKRALAPVPEGVTCGATLERGCRALSFSYASATGATGGNPDQWGDYKDRLVKVDLHAFDQSSGAMKATGVARYAYDASGFLRAAWDPRISPALKTAYDYDAQGHLIKLTPPGEEPWTFSHSALAGDQDSGRLASVARPAMPGMATTSLRYNVPLTGDGAPHAMGADAVRGWGQKVVPTDATAIFRPGDAPTTSADGLRRSAIHYLDRRGRSTNQAAPGGGISTTEYDDHGNIVRELTAANRSRVLAGGGFLGLGGPDASELDTRRTYSADGLDLVDEIGPLHEVQLGNGEKVKARRHTEIRYDEASPEPGMHLPTSTTTGATIAGRAADEDVRVTRTSYDWPLRKPTAQIQDARAGGLNLTQKTLYDPKTGLETERRMPKSPNSGDAGATRTLYYTAGSHPTDSQCGSRPEWANLPCRERPAAQPGSPGLSDLPVTTFAYSDLGLPAKVTEVAGAKQRTTQITYDEAGREKAKAVNSDEGAPTPRVDTAYDPSTGRATKASTTENGATQEVKRTFDTLGRLIRYTDADGNTATTTYDLLDRPVVTNDGKGTQTRTYDPVTGLPTRLEDSAAGVFTARYDADARLVSQGLPNGLEARTTLNEEGRPIKLDYEKQSSCSSDCTWLSFEATESIHGQWLAHKGTLSRQTYTYDPAGRLTQVSDTPAGKGCTVRSYAYDANSNRTQKATRQPGAGGDCQPGAAASTVEHGYDSADRELGRGYTYDAFGRTTGMLGGGTGDSALLSEYYADDAAFRHEQDGRVNTYLLDPLRRQRLETVTAPDSVDRREISHYSDDSDAPAWSASPGDAEFTRNIKGLDGNLAAVQVSNGQTDLQLTNLHGDVVASASLDPGASRLVQTFETDEFGVPREGQEAPRYGYLGGKQREAELPSGVTRMGVRSYVPSEGRFTATDPVTGGSANSYDYAFADPVNKEDLDGRHGRYRHVAPHSNGCGPRHWILRYIPDLFHYACDLHDECYHHKSYSRHQCDSRFYWRMHRKCNTGFIWWLPYKYCYSIAYNYYKAVRRYGAPSYY